MKVLAHLATLLPALVWGQCPESTLEIDITPGLGGLRFVGFNPTVSRFSGNGMVSLKNAYAYLLGIEVIILESSSSNEIHATKTYLSNVTIKQGNKIVLKNYAVEPLVSSTFQAENLLVISAGKSCTVEAPMPSASPVESPTLAPVASSAFKLAVSTVFGLLTGSPLVSSITLAAAGFMAVDAQATACTESIDVEIYTDAHQIVASEYKAGEFEVCPPEVSLIVTSTMNVKYFSPC